MSQYVANLNTIPSANDLNNDFNLGDDLDFLTNAEFFDFDSFQTPNVDFNHSNPHDGQPKTDSLANGSMGLGIYAYCEILC